MNPVLTGTHLPFDIFVTEFYMMMDTIISNCAEQVDEQGKSVDSERNNEKNGDSPNSTECLSKRAQRKLLKRQQWLETRPERRAKEKAKKRAKIERIRQEKGRIK